MLKCHIKTFTCISFYTCVCSQPTYILKIYYTVHGLWYDGIGTLATTADHTYRYIHIVQGIDFSLGQGIQYTTDIAILGYAIVRTYIRV